MNRDNYLVISAEEGAVLIRYQEEMLRYNPQPGIIALQHKLTNGRVSLHYLVGARQTLSQLLRQGRAIGSMAELSLRIADILQDSMNILLEPAAFLLDPSYIYLEPEKQEIALLYWPFKAKLTVRESFIHLLTSIKEHLASPATEQELGEILAYLEQDYTELADFKKYLAQLSFHYPAQARTVHEKPFKLSGTAARPVPQRQPGYRSLSHVLLIFLLSQVVIAVLLLGCSYYLDFLDKSSLTYAGLFVLIGAVDVFILRRLFRQS